MVEPNWIKVIAASVAGLLFAAIWYGPVFGAVWKDRTRASEEQIAARNPVVVFAASLIFCFVGAYAFHMYLGQNPSMEMAVGNGVLIGGCWAATSFGMSALLTAQPFALYMIDAAFVTLLFALFGLIYGLL